MKKQMPKSLRKHIRREKARIRGEFFDKEKQKQLIEDLHQKILKNHKSNKKDENTGNL